jgi:hypothetical protein
LLEDEGNREWPRLERVIPDRRSKVARLRQHLGTITARLVHLPREADWVAASVSEVVEFPNGDFDDQVDALTQALDYLSKGPELVAPPAPPTGFVGSRGSVQAIRPHAERLDGNARGVVVAASRGFRSFY